MLFPTITVKALKAMASYINRHKTNVVKQQQQEAKLAFTRFLQWQSSQEMSVSIGNYEPIPLIILWYSTEIWSITGINRKCLEAFQTMVHRRTSQPKLVDLVRQMTDYLVLSLHSSCETCELLQWLCHDDSTTCTAIIITIIN